MSENTGIGILMLLVWAFVSLSGLAVYLIPTIIAGTRRHRNWLGIFLVNFLLGWTLVGWVAALVWSVHRERDPAIH